MANTIVAMMVAALAATNVASAVSRTNTWDGLRRWHRDGEACGNRGVPVVHAVEDGEAGRLERVVKEVRRRLLFIGTW
jgi:hypothetical protein